MNPYADTETDSAVAADLGERVAVAEHGVETIGLPDGRSLVRTLHQSDVVEGLIDLDEYASAPRRKTGRVELLTVPSLTAYVGKHQTPGTEVWVRPDLGRFEAVLDDHEPIPTLITIADDGEITEPQVLVAGGEPGWGDHRAVCVLAQTRDWRHWLSQDGKLLSQLDFAEHLEAGLHTIVQPSAADLLEVAQTLTGSRNVSWKSGARLSDGQVQLKYEEDVQGRAGSAGDLEIPQTFVVGVQPFEGTDVVHLTASLRWRMTNGTVALGYRLQRPDVVLREAVDGLIDQVESELDRRVLLGTPRAARQIP